MRMYIPRGNAIEDEAEIREFVTSAGSAEFITVGDDGWPAATLLPILWDGSTVVAHLARANAQWRHICPGGRALLICRGAQAYISPGWYPAKAEHGRVVPTWNYSAVHLTGTVRVHEDADWLLDAVSRLTDRHEQGRDGRWRVTDAPPEYVNGQLRGIVGLEITVVGVEAKAKMSQNRSEADCWGVVDGLRGEGVAGASEIADAMEMRRNRSQ